jgi:N-acetylglucosamine-6-phosphate deacetylase
MNDMVRVFRDLTGCPLWQAVRMASLTPATIIGAHQELGSLTKGKLGDIIFLDEQLNVHRTFLGGRQIP